MFSIIVCLVFDPYCAFKKIIFCFKALLNVTNLLGIIIVILACLSVIVLLATFAYIDFHVVLCCTNYYCCGSIQGPLIWDIVSLWIYLLILVTQQILKFIEIGLPLLTARTYQSGIARFVRYSKQNISMIRLLANGHWIIHPSLLILNGFWLKLVAKLILIWS